MASFVLGTCRMTVMDQKRNTQRRQMLLEQYGGDVPMAGHAKRIDLSLCDPAGMEQFRLPDIPFAPETGGVVWQQSITFAKAAPTSSMVARLLAIDEEGSESLIGEYTFNHTRTLPGPGAW